MEETKRKRSTTQILLAIFLIVAIVATIAVSAIIATTVTKTARGAQAITDPIGDLVRQLVVEATPVILPNPAIIVEEINSLARLETASYSFQDIVQIERNNDLLWGSLGESLLFVAYGDVVAGVDLAQLQPRDLQVVDANSVIVRMPKAEILFSSLDNERSYVANRDIGLFTKGDPNLETQVRQEAESRMLEAALADGILDMADEEAEKFILSLLNELGFDQVVFSDTTPPLVTPFIEEMPKGFVVTPAPTIIVAPTATPQG